MEEDQGQQPVRVPPFQSQNLGLSTALFTCGVPFLKDSDGMVMPVTHFYNGEILKRLGYKGWLLEEAALDAWKKKRQGAIYYNFEGTQLCHKVVNIWDDHAKLLKLQDEAAERGGTFSNDSCDIDVEPEKAVRLFCSYAKNRRRLYDQWLYAKPILMLMGDMKTEREGDKITTIGSFKGYTLTAGQAIRSKLKI